MRCSTTNAAWPFVEMPHRRLDAERAQHAHAADAEDDLLLDPRLAVAAVERGRELAIPRRVLIEVGVEQEQAHADRRARPRPAPCGPERHGRDAGPPSA